MFNLEGKTKALRKQLADAEQRAIETRKVSDVIAADRDRAVNAKAIAEQKQRDAERALDEAKAAHAAELQAKQAQLDAKADELKVLEDLQRQVANRTALIAQIRQALRAGEGVDLVAAVRGQTTLIENLELLLADINELRDDAGGEAVPADDDARPQAPDGAISVGDDPGPADQPAAVVALDVSAFPDPPGTTLVDADELVR